MLVKLPRNQEAYNGEWMTTLQYGTFPPFQWRWCGVDATRVTGAWRFADKSICDCVNMLLRFRAGNDSASENTNAKYSHECYVHIDLYGYVDMWNWGGEAWLAM